jgi:hypothetical protein
MDKMALSKIGGTGGAVLSGTRSTVESTNHKKARTYNSIPVSKPIASNLPGQLTGYWQIYGSALCSSKSGRKNLLWVAEN